MFQVGADLEQGPGGDGGGDGRWGGEFGAEGAEEGEEDGAGEGRLVRADRGLDGVLRGGAVPNAGQQGQSRFSSLAVAGSSGMRFPKFRQGLP